MNQLTLGSLFDGIGGFPLAGIKSGIHPVWASEIEPFPVRVTQKRLPDMKHYGDVSKLNGGDLEPVDIITFGSPCQDLSIAGKRNGLDGTRSGLFREAIRIITEMRCKTNGRSPRWAVWENVPGALSSANGRDFREVLESLIRIKDPKADVPMPDSGKWLPAGEILGDNYSLAWRILDASKGWGVAQRRKRIFAVLDLDGQCAGSVLFESEGLSGYTPPRCETRQGTARGTEEGAGEAGLCLNDQGGSRMDVTREMTSTLRAEAHHPPCIMGASGFCTEHSADSRSIGYREEESPTLRAGVTPGVAIEYNPTDSRIKVKEDGICQTLCSRMGTGGNNIPLVFDISADQSNAMLSDNPHSGVYEADTSRTLDCNGGSPACNQGGMMIVKPVCDGSFCIQGSMIGRKDENGPQGDGINQDVSFTLNTIDRHAVYAVTTGEFTAVGQEQAPPLMARDWKDPPVVGRPCEEYLVRRLTPDECCRLQGYPDGWCKDLESEDPDEDEIRFWTDVFQEWDAINGKPDKVRSRNAILKWLTAPNSDAAEYKAYGNSVAVPCVFFVLAGIVWAQNKEVKS
ncbi:MAG: DNA cytosine methyltransferase [Candidatus Limiplasma sp.]|nr:DNA cytosine methyltransferase [Candidatus Limiplasma sp.]